MPLALSDSLRFLRDVELCDIQTAEKQTNNMQIYIGNLSYNTGETQIQSLFAPYGVIENVQVIMDKFTGRSRGFGFVTMPNDQEAQAAIAALDGKEFEGRALKINEARPREEGGGSRPPRRPFRGGGGGRGAGRREGGGGYRR